MSKSCATADLNQFDIYPSQLNWNSMAIKSGFRHRLLPYFVFNFLDLEIDLDLFGINLSEHDH